MPDLELQPFSHEHLDAAAALLAERHRRHRAAEPLLPEDVDVRAEIESLLAAPGASGTTAVRENRVVGYLIGAPRADPAWGPNVWVEPAGHAVEEPEAVRDLYAAAAERWVDAGWSRHYVVVPATDRELVDAWFRLSFGQQQAFGIREVAGEPWPAGVRLAEARDVDSIVEQVPLLNRHQGRSPVFSARPITETADELRAELEEDMESGELANLVAEVDGRVVGNFEVVPVQRSSMHVGLSRPERACFLSFAIVAPEARGSGAGLALTRASFAWAYERGYETMVTDWRVTNLLASRFWPRRGFRTSFLRLYRSIP